MIDGEEMMFIRVTKFVSWSGYASIVFKTAVGHERGSRDA